MTHILNLLHFLYISVGKNTHDCAFLLIIFYSSKYKYEIANDFTLSRYCGMINTNKLFKLISYMCSQQFVIYNVTACHRLTFLTFRTQKACKLSFYSFKAREHAHLIFFMISKILSLSLIWYSISLISHDIAATLSLWATIVDASLN